MFLTTLTLTLSTIYWKQYVSYWLHCDDKEAENLFLFSLQDLPGNETTLWVVCVHPSTAKFDISN
jgi:hypothetical protein